MCDVDTRNAVIDAMRGIFPVKIACFSHASNEKWCAEVRRSAYAATTADLRFPRRLHLAFLALTGASVAAAPECTRAALGGATARIGASPSLRSLEVCSLSKTSCSAKTMG